MTPERTARLVARWVRFYTRGLPTAVGVRRVEEIDADVHDQIAHERAGGRRDWRISLAIGSRLVRGLVADAAWRRRHITATGRTSRPASRSVVRVALVVTFILSLPLLAMQMTGQVVWSLSDFVVAGALLTGTGLLLELAARKARNHSYRAAAVVAIGAAFLLVWLNLAVGHHRRAGRARECARTSVCSPSGSGAPSWLASGRPDMARAALATALAQVARCGRRADRRQGPVPGQLRLGDRGAERALRGAVHRVGRAVPARSKPATSTRTQLVIRTPTAYACESKPPSGRTRGRSDAPSVHVNRKGLYDLFGGYDACRRKSSTLGSWRM